MSYIKNDRVANNIQALKELKSDNKSIDILSRYSGWGGLRAAIFTPSVYKEIKSILNEEEINSLKQTLTNAYYTPDLLIKFMWACAQSLGFTGGAVLEPAAGTGKMLDHMPQKLKHVSAIDAIELDKTSCDFLLAKHGNVNLICTGFENCYFGVPAYDLIIGNPPFGNQTLRDIRFKDLDAIKIHHFFAAKSAMILKENGIMALVMPSFFLDNQREHARDIIANEGVNLLAAYRLPDDLFEGAKVTIDIVFLQKCKSTNIAWTKVKPQTIDGYTKYVNEYFINHPNHILGRLEVISMYGRMGVTCRKTTDIREQLVNAYRNLKAKLSLK